MRNVKIRTVRWISFLLGCFGKPQTHCMHSMHAHTTPPTYTHMHMHTHEHTHSTHMHTHTHTFPAQTRACIPSSWVRWWRLAPAQIVAPYSPFGTAAVVPAVLPHVPPAHSHPHPSLVPSPQTGRTGVMRGQYAIHTSHSAVQQTSGAEGS